MADYQSKKNSFLYPFSFNLDIGSNYMDSNENIIHYPSLFSYKAEITKQLPAGASLTLDLSYDFTRGIINFFSDISSDDIGYSHKPQINLVFKQSFLPYWMQGEKNNPEKTILLLNTQEEKLNKDILEKQIIYNVTYYYIQYRKILRDIYNTTKQIELIKLILKELQTEFLNGNISKNEIWKKELELNNAIELLNQNIEQKNNFMQMLNQLCGLNYEINFDEKLPAFSNKNLTTDLSMNLLLNDINKLKLQYVISRQNNAPKLKISGTFSETTKTQMKIITNYIDDKTSLDWSATIGVEFPELFTSNNKIQKNNYILSMKNLENQIENYKYRNSLEIEKYNYLIKMYKELEKQTFNIKVSYEDYYKNILEQNKLGVLSKINILETKQNILLTENKLNNYKDLVWFYSWAKGQLYDFKN